MSLHTKYTLNKWSHCYKKKLKHSKNINNKSPSYINKSIPYHQSYQQKQKLSSTHKENLLNINFYMISLIDSQTHSQIGRMSSLKIDMKYPPTKRKIKE